MAQIQIKDLEENTELDRAAMRAISGGQAGRSAAVELPRLRFENPLSFGTVRLLPEATSPRFLR